MPSNLSDLIKRIEEAEGGSRELNFWIWWWGKAANGGAAPDPEYAADNIKRNDAPPHSTSLDAKLPGENIVAFRRCVPPFEMGVWWEATHESDGWCFVARAKTRVLAERLAYLKYLEAKEAE